MDSREPGRRPARAMANRTFALCMKLALPVLMAASAAPAWSQPAPTTPWSSVLAAAKKEGKVVLYTSMTVPVVTRVAAGFKKANPDIAIEFTRGPLVPKIEQERTTGSDGADVYISSQPSLFFGWTKEGKLLRPRGPSAASWPARYSNDAAFTVGMEYFVIVYNKKLLPSPPKGYGDLLRPELKGKLGAAELSATAIVAWYDWLEKTQGNDFLPKLKAQNPKMYQGCLAPAQAVAAGELIASTLGCVSTSKDLMKEGAPIDYVSPNPAFGIQWVMGALGWSKRPNAALVLADYVMSRDGQAAWHGTGESASPLPDIPGALRASDIYLPDPNGFPDEAEKKYREYWTRIFKG